MPGNVGADMADMLLPPRLIEETGWWGRKLKVRERSVQARAEPNSVILARR